ncbi:MAG: hypothetical protein AAF989_14965, partial [Planctomycetota bacterium]
QIRDMIPGMAWLTKLDLENLPNLKNADCLMTDLESIRLRNMARLRRLRIGSYFLRFEDQMEYEPIPLERRQRVLDELGQGDGPRELEFELFQFEGIDFTGLAKNRSIRSLTFNLTDLDFDQVRNLQTMKQVETLQLGGCDLPDEGLTWLLEKFPNAQRIAGNATHTRNLEIESNPKLQNLDITFVSQPGRVRLVDVNQLRSHLLLLDAPESLQIDQAESLRGLAVGGPWKKEHHVEGLRKLRWFAGGGPDLGNEVFDRLQDCTQLEELTFAYANLSRDRLESINQFDRLYTLMIPGANLDDSMVESWPDLRYLMHLNFDRTAIDVKTMRWVNRLRSARSLSIAGVRLSEQAKPQLQTLGHLSWLQIADTGIESQYWRPILKGDSIRHLDLSGLSVPDDVVDDMIACESLVRLQLNRAEVSTTALERLFAARDDLLVWIDPDHPSMTDELRARLEDRVISRPKPAIRIKGNWRGRASDDLLASQLAFQRPGKIDIDLLHQRIQKGASSSSIASEKAAFASSTASPVTPP